MRQNKRRRITVVQKPGRSFRITVPVDVAEDFGVEPYDEFMWESREDHIRLYPVRTVLASDDRDKEEVV